MEAITDIMQLRPTAATAAADDHFFNDVANLTAAAPT
jgi:hypothetical protein